MKINVNLASPPDRNKLVAEVFIENEQIAEINKENDIFEIEIYPKKNGESWKLSFKEIIEKLTQAQAMLEERV